jgi:P27 family predicted phage terminase small subunit
MGARGPVTARSKVEPRFKVEMPIKPDTLSPVASKQWDKLAPMLYEAGVLTEADGSALEIMCEAWATYVRYKEIVDKTPVTRGANQQLIINPLDRLKKSALRDYQNYLDGFGMTPRMRQRVSVVEKPRRLAEIKQDMKQIAASVDNVEVSTSDDISEILKRQADKEATFHDRNNPQTKRI